MHSWRFCFSLACVAWRFDRACKQAKVCEGSETARRLGQEFYFSRGCTAKYWPDKTAMLRMLLLVERAHERRSPAREEWGGNNKEPFSRSASSYAPQLFSLSPNKPPATHAKAKETGN